MLAAELGRPIAELEREATIISFPKHYLDNPKDHYIPIGKIGLWAKMRGMKLSPKTEHDLDLDLDLDVEVAANHLRLHELCMDWADELCYPEHFAVSAQIILEEAKELWDEFRPTHICLPDRSIVPISLVPSHVTIFVVRKRTDEEILGALMTYLYYWDDEAKHGDYAASRLTLRSERAYKILLTPYDA